MKYIILGISALLMLGGCVGQPKPQPQPKPVVKKVEKPKPKRVYKKAPRKHGKVPPLPEREVDLDMDDMVDQAMAETLNDDNAVQAMP
ncbi:MAG: hypothetical protein U9R26_07960 [Campylobacterota bacterium]|nr:hypothetical protein [Campylobacterota bacterium]